ncbi:glycosyltransferase family 2 protein [Candidatus Daviesbacteria bacterium]|nr:glycosyltransferase family 2 protein [Candidatus Daviesbacteria bacterium]
MTSPKISIIFPNFNGGKEPLDCLKSIKNLNYPKSQLEVIVIDNNSTDGSDLKIKIKFPKVKLIKNKTNLGFAKAINQGIKKSTGQYILITNDDVVFGKDSFKIMTDYLKQNPEVGVLGGKIFLKSNPKKIISAGFMFNRWTGQIYMAKNPDQSKEPDWVQGCCMMVPKKVINKIGLVDEGFSLIYFEDIDFCFRARESGFQVTCLPEAKFWHGNTVTMNKNKPEKYYQWYKNKFRFILKHMPPANIINILLIQIFLVMPFNVIHFKEGRLVPLLKGFFWNILNLKKTLNARNNG